MLKVVRTFLILLIILLPLGLGIIFYINRQSNLLVSPVLGIAKSRIADNIWFPQQSGTGSLEEVEITAKAAFFIDTETGRVLYEKSSKERLPIASLTKVMTAIVALENANLTDKLRVSQRAAEMEPDKMLLIAGEMLTLDELLQGMFLVSANDASEVLAEEVTGRREEFISLMNSKAAQLGMNDTYFINPSGLEEDEGKQYSTAFDVAVMSRYAINRYPHLLNISSQPHIYIPATDTHQDYDLYSGINLLTTYPGVQGFKTGYTPEAGLTLVTVAKKDGKQVLGVLLGAVNRREDAKLLLDHSFKKLGVN